MEKERLRGEPGTRVPPYNTTPLGVLGLESGFRSAIISGGVWVSLPSQKGQLLLFANTGGILKSSGRLARSPATIIHLPRIGSFLNSGISHRLHRLSHPLSRNSMKRYNGKTL